MSEDNFIACLVETLKQECPRPEDWENEANFSNDAHDPGGQTMCGVTQREYDVARKHRGLSVRSVRYITRSEGLAIYHDSYWQPHCPALAPGLDLQFFDTSVNEGAHGATLVLQDAVHAVMDGVWGRATQDAVNRASLAQLIARFTLCRRAAYRRLRGYQYYHTDWERRAEEIGAAALAMAHGVSAHALRGTRLVVPQILSSPIVKSDVQIDQPLRGRIAQIDEGDTFALLAKLLESLKTVKK